MEGTGTPRLIFPAGVRLGQLTTFLRVVSSYGGAVDVAQVSSELDTDLTQLIPILDAAEMLGLAVVEKGDVKLSKDALVMLHANRRRILVVQGALSKVEPFKTALSFKGPFTARDLAEELAAKGIRWHHEDEVNNTIVGQILFNWGIFAGFLEYDGSDSTFRVKPEAQVSKE